jgi:hypothetical protein
MAGTVPFRNISTCGSISDGFAFGPPQLRKVPSARPKMNAVHGSIMVNAPISTVYRKWLQLEDLPKFISAVEQVKKLHAKHFLVAISHKGQRYEGVLEIIILVRERRLAWRVVARTHPEARLLSSFKLAGRPHANSAIAGALQNGSD